MQTRSLTQHISQHLDGTCLEAGQREMLVEVAADSPAGTSRNNLCSGAVEAREMQQAVGCSVLGWLALGISLCFQDCPRSGLWVRHTSLSCPWFSQDLDWLPGLLTEVQIRYKHFINL